MLFSAVLQLIFITLAFCRSEQTRTLFVHSTSFENSVYSNFIKDLQNSTKLELTSNINKLNELFIHEELLYENVVLFGIDLAEENMVLGLIKYTELNGNIMLVASEKPNKKTRTFANQFGVLFDYRSSKVVDHFSNLNNSKVILTTKYNKKFFESSKPFRFQGLGQTLLQKNGLITKIVTAENTAYSLGADGSTSLYGDDITLISAFQTLKNSRLIFVGTTSLFVNEYLTASDKLANLELISKINKWFLQQVKKIKVISHKHSKKDILNPDTYVVKDFMTYEIQVSEFYDNRWIPYIAGDLQLEIKMIDVYIRRTLKLLRTENEGAIYTTSLMLPDKHGMFTLQVLYKNEFYSFLETRDIVAVKPLDHNMHKRFINVAYPYYAAATSNLVVFVLFSSVYAILLNQKTKLKGQ